MTFTRSGLLLIGFSAAVGLRLVIGGPGVSQSPVAGLAFGACLFALALAVRVRVRLSGRSMAWGLVGIAVLCLPVLVGRGDRSFYSGPGFAGWAVVVTFVAVSEEVFLRGALYDSLSEVLGSVAAITGGAIAFALLHVPLYGWHVLPLDLLVGFLLGELRRRADSPTAPAITHVGADLAAWFLR